MRLLRSLGYDVSALRSGPLGGKLVTIPIPTDPRGAPVGPLTGAGAPILLVHGSLELESSRFSVSSSQLASGQNFLARRAIHYCLPWAGA